MIIPTCKQERIQCARDPQAGGQASRTLPSGSAQPSPAARAQGTPLHLHRPLLPCPKGLPAPHPPRDATEPFTGAPRTGDRKAEKLELDQTGLRLRTPGRGCLCKDTAHLPARTQNKALPSPQDSRWLVSTRVGEPGCYVGGTRGPLAKQPHSGQHRLWTRRQRTERPGRGTGAWVRTPGRHGRNSLHRPHGRG